MGSFLNLLTAQRAYFHNALGWSCSIPGEEQDGICTSLLLPFEGKMKQQQLCGGWEMRVRPGEGGAGACWLDQLVGQPPGMAEELTAGGLWLWLLPLSSLLQG